MEYKPHLNGKKKKNLGIGFLDSLNSVNCLSGVSIIMVVSCVKMLCFHALPHGIRLMNFYYFSCNVLKCAFQIGRASSLNIHCHQEFACTIFDRILT